MRCMRSSNTRVSEHVAQRHLQFLRVEVRVPGTDRAMPLVEHADEPFRKMPGLGGRGSRVGARELAGRRQLEVAEIRGVPGSRGRLGDVKA